MIWVEKYRDENISGVKKNLCTCMYKVPEESLVRTLENLTSYKQAIHVMAQFYEIVILQAKNLPCTMCLVHTFLKKV